MASLAKHFSLLSLLLISLFLSSHAGEHDNFYKFVRHSGIQETPTPETKRPPAQTSEEPTDSERYFTRGNENIAHSLYGDQETPATHAAKETAAAATTTSENEQLSRRSTNHNDQAYVTQAKSKYGDATPPGEVTDRKHTTTTSVDEKYGPSKRTGYDNPLSHYYFNFANKNTLTEPEEEPEEDERGGVYSQTKTTDSFEPVDVQKVRQEEKYEKAKDRAYAQTHFYNRYDNNQYDPNSFANLETEKSRPRQAENTKPKTSGKQGMSDTRFQDHGKYYYDLQSEQYDSPPSKKFNSLPKQPNYEHFPTAFYNFQNEFNKEDGNNP